MALALTPEQRSRTEAIVARTARSQAVVREFADRLPVVADSVKAELRQILTPEQRVRLDSLRRDSQFMLKRRVVTPGGTKVDTLIDSTGRTTSP